MDWRSVRFDWNRARAFLVTAEEGSLSAAARALGMSQPTLGRQVDALEEELEVLLFERVGKRLVLTEAGLGLLEHARAMGEAASRVSLAASGHSQALEGEVTITVGEIFGARVLPPIIARLRADEPGIRIEIVATNETSDLRRREADIAIRNVRPQHPDLIARKIRDMAGNLYAASVYLDRIGRPTTPAGFSDADFVGFDLDGGPMIAALGHVGFSLQSRNFTSACQNQLVQWELVRAGLGIGVNSELIGDAEPGVERILPAMPSIPFPLWLVSHRELHTSRRVRFVFERLAAELAALFDHPTR
ncbi:MAG: LysR family transcriptional regulator [Myxococcales bacterium]|nr:LysR family transcriptional regulator [Myxococcales bacterium]MCB9570137.1 LysR family transcriptional regulator [Myxococcales bacterium]MCB9705196.1 LysR family transcriptional regulator [Myxococcales bacterium]